MPRERVRYEERMEEKSPVVEEEEEGVVLAIFDESEADRRCVRAAARNELLPRSKER